MKATYSGNDINSREGDAGALLIHIHLRYSSPGEVSVFASSKSICCGGPLPGKAPSYQVCLLCTPTALAYQLEKEFSETPCNYFTTLLQ